MPRQSPLVAHGTSAELALQILRMSQGPKPAQFPWVWNKPPRACTSSDSSQAQFAATSDERCTVGEHTRERNAPR